MRWRACRRVARHSVLRELIPRDTVYADDTGAWILCRQQDKARLMRSALLTFVMRYSVACVHESHVIAARSFSVANDFDILALMNVEKLWFFTIVHQVLQGGKALN